MSLSHYLSLVPIGAVRLVIRGLSLGEKAGVFSEPPAETRREKNGDLTVRGYPRYLEQSRQSIGSRLDLFTYLHKIQWKEKAH